MENNVILIGIAVIDEETGKYGDYMYHAAIPDGPVSELLSTYKSVVSILLCEEWLGKYSECLAELDACSNDIMDMLEGRRDHFWFANMHFNMTRLPLDDGQDDDIPVSSVRQGTELFVRFENNTAVGVSTAIFGDGDYDFVRFYRESTPKTLTLNDFMPFVIEGDAGYMVLPDGSRGDKLYDYAKPLAGLNYIVNEVVDGDHDSGRSYIINRHGHQLTPYGTKIEAGNPGYNGCIPFIVGDKWGFIHVDSGTVSPVEYEDIAPVQLDEYIHVKKNGEWGYLAEDFTFISDRLVAEDDEKADDRYWAGDDI